MKRVWLLAGIVAGLALVGGAGYIGFHSRPASAADTPTAPNTVAVSVCDVSQSVTGTGNAASTGDTVVRMPFSGPLGQVLVKPGDTVQAGQVLARLNEPDVLMALAQAQTDVANAQDDLQSAQSARAGLDLPRSGNLSAERALLELQTADKQVQEAQKNYNLVSDLPSDNPRRLGALGDLVDAQQAYQRALINYNWFSGHASAQDIAEADARVALDKATLAQAQDRWNTLRGLFGSGDAISANIQAPSSGVILEVSAASGDIVNAGAALFTLDDPSALDVAVTVTEEDYPYVNVGQTAQLFFDALPDVQLSGKVSRILPQRAPGDSPLYYVYIQPDSIPLKLVDGMTADASILVAERKQVLCLPRALVHASTSGTAVVTVWDGSRSQSRQITVGLRGDTNVEILTGLKAGDQVVSR